MKKSPGSNVATPLSPPPLCQSKMAGSFIRKATCFVTSCTDFYEFGANCCCFGCTESIVDGFEYIRSQGHPLDVKVKQNDVKFPIFLYKFSVSNCVIYVFILEVYVLQCAGLK